MLVLSKASKSSLKEIKFMLEKLGNYSGLLVNSTKSKIFFSKCCSNKEELQTIIGFTEGQLPSKYLGLPLSPVYLKPKHFSPLNEKCRAILEGWSMLTLSLIELSSSNQ